MTGKRHRLRTGEIMVFSRCRWAKVGYAFSSCLSGRIRPILLSVPIPEVRSLWRSTKNRHIDGPISRIPDEKLLYFFADMFWNFPLDPVMRWIVGGHAVTKQAL